MEYLLIAAVVIGLILIASKKKKDKKPQPAPVPVVEPAPVAQAMPTGNWIYIDDMVRSLSADKGGDYNAPQDLACVLAIAEKFNSWPEIIGVSQVRGGNAKSVVQAIVNAAGLDIPVLSGAPTDAGDESELSRWMVERSKKGRFHVCLGAPATDTAQAIRDGATTDSIRLHALLKGTWNEISTPNHKRDSDLVQAKVRSKRQIQAPRFHILLNKHAGAYQDTAAFIEHNKAGNPMWQMVNNNFVLQQNRNMNRAQGFTAGALRIADCLTVLDYFGVDVYNNPNGMFSVIQHGLDKMKARLN